MIEAEVRRLADAAAIEAGWDLEHYEPGENRHHEDGSWTVFYLGKVPLVGNHFSIHLKPGEEVRIVAGR